MLESVWVWDDKKSVIIIYELFKNHPKFFQNPLINLKLSFSVWDYYLSHNSLQSSTLYIFIIISILELVEVCLKYTFIIYIYFAWNLFPKKLIILNHLYSEEMQTEIFIKTKLISKSANKYIGERTLDGSIHLKLFLLYIFC